MFSFFGFIFLAGGVLYLSSDKKWSDRKKIELIFERLGLCYEEGSGKKKVKKKIKLHRQTSHAWGTEYAYQLPFPLYFDQINNYLNAIQDGLNNKNNGLQKKVEMDFDGMLRIRVYEKELTGMFPYNDELLGKCGGWKVPVGVTNKGEIVWHDFDSIPHLIVAGTTQYGKTVFLKQMITTLVANRADRVTFTLLDLKGGLAFNRFDNISQVDCVASDAYESCEALEELKNKIEERLEKFRFAGFENIRDSKIKYRHFIVVDEAAELSSVGLKGKEKEIRQACESHLAYIARVAGGLGYRLVYATQYPTADVLPRQIKQNADAKLCFRLQTAKASEVVLGMPGAEKLPEIKGRAIYLDNTNPVVVQAPYIENEYIEKVIKPWKGVKIFEHDATPRKEDRGNIIEFR